VVIAGKLLINDSPKRSTQMSIFFGMQGAHY